VVTGIVSQHAARGVVAPGLRIGVPIEGERVFFGGLGPRAAPE